MANGISTQVLKERVILVGIIRQEQTEEEVAEFLEELAFLTETAGAIPIRAYTQKIDIPNPGTYIGAGKLAVNLFLRLHVQMQIRLPSAHFSGL